MMKAGAIIRQLSLPLGTVARRIGSSEARVRAILHGAQPTEREYELLVDLLDRKSAAPKCFRAKMHGGVVISANFR
jgi:hypothetical protein